VRWFLARHHVVPSHELVEWVAADRTVALCAAYRPNVAILVDSPGQLDMEVRIAVARNPLTPPEVLTGWVDAHTDGAMQDQIDMGLAANPQTPIHVCLAFGASSRLSRDDSTAPVSPRRQRRDHST